MDGISPPRQPKQYPFVLEEHLIRALLAACNRSNLHGARNYAMLLLFVDCGLRLNELLSLRLADLSLSQRSLKVHGMCKGPEIGSSSWELGHKVLRRWLDLRGFRT
jgi:site-specific recombinase XerC